MTMGATLHGHGEQSGSRLLITHLPRGWLWPTKGHSPLITEFLIYGSAIRNRANLHRFNNLQFSNRRQSGYKGLQLTLVVHGKAKPGFTAALGFAILKRQAAAVGFGDLPAQDEADA